ncbi:MAG: hypothetical protein HUU60_05465 [Armatimonadetes bacterium]|nr:hypothetical protein [Armatimonadota bacterium]
MVKVDLNCESRGSLAKWLFGGAIVAGAVTAMLVYKRFQQRHLEPEYLADKAYERGLRQVQSVGSRIPRWLAERG